MRLQSDKRRGQLPVLIAIALVAILAFVALALEGGLLLNQRRHAQVAAEAAALAAAARLYDHMNTDGTDYQSPYTQTEVIGWAKDTAKAYAAANGYDEDRGDCIVTRNIPPESGPNAGKFGYAEVIIEAQQRRRFSSIFGRDDFVVKARAVACVARRPIPYAIVVLDPRSKGSFTAKGQGDVKVDNAGVIVDSNHDTGGIVTGGGIVIAPTFDFTGTPGSSGNFQGKITSGQPVVPDPLAALPVPDPSALTLRSSKKLDIRGDTPVTLEPGRYIGGISIASQGSVTLNPGIYYMDGGGFSVTGQGNLTGNGIMIYNAATKNSDNINIAGQGGVVNLTPPTSGTYAGILLFQARDSIADVSVTGDGKYQMTGTFYAARANLKVAGNGDAQIGSQFVSYAVTTDGGGKLQITWAPDTTGRTLYFGLVE